MISRGTCPPEATSNINPNKYPVQYRTMKCATRSMRRAAALGQKLTPTSPLCSVAYPARESSQPVIGVMDIGHLMSIGLRCGPGGRLKTVVHEYRPTSSGSYIKIQCAAGGRESNRSLFFLFLNLSPLRLGLLNDLLLQLPRHRVVVMHLHIEAAAALRHRGQVDAVSPHLGHGHFGLHDSVPCLVFHALDAPAPAVQIAHDRARKIIRYSDLDGHDRLQNRRLRLFHRFAERNAPSHLE